MVVLATILMVGVSVGCFDDGNIGYEIKPTIGDATNSPRYRIKSGGTKFDVDNIALDFHYGGCGADGDINIFHDTDSNAYFVCFALYFLDGQYFSSDFRLGPWRVVGKNDYQDIESHHLIKTISYDKFNSEEYYVLARNLGNHTFNHQETITVPREVFERESGSFIFQVAEVWFLPNTDCYGIAVRNFIHVNYDYIDEQTIRLSRPANSTPR